MKTKCDNCTLKCAYHNVQFLWLDFPSSLQLNLDIIITMPYFWCHIIEDDNMNKIQGQSGA